MKYRNRYTNKLILEMADRRCKNPALRLSQKTGVSTISKKTGEVVGGGAQGHDFAGDSGEVKTKADELENIGTGKTIEEKKAEEKRIAKAKFGDNPVLLKSAYLAIENKYKNMKESVTSFFIDDNKLKVLHEGKVMMVSRFLKEEKELVISIKGNMEEEGFTGNLIQYIRNKVEQKESPFKEEV